MVACSPTVSIKPTKKKDQNRNQINNIDSAKTNKKFTFHNEIKKDFKEIL